VADTAYSTLVPRIQGEIPDCPDFFIESRIQEVAMDFFKETKAWCVDLDEAATIKDNSTYDLETPSKTAVSEILSLRFLTSNLIPRTAGQMAADDPQWRTQGGSPAYYTQLSSDTFTVSPIPTETTAKALNVRVAIYPTMAATRIDSVVFNDNYNALVNGTLARILLMVGKIWSDPNMGAVYNQAYVQEVDAAKMLMCNSRVRPTRRVKYGGI
jgi:hypothetical protein